MLADASAATPVAVQLDPVSLVLHSSGPVFVVVWSLVAAAGAVWVIAVLKALQLKRMASEQTRFEQEASQAQHAEQLFGLARKRQGAPGARVVLAVAQRHGGRQVLEAVAKRAIVAEQQRAGSLLPVLSTIASAGPFVGLFGTVYGIMDAFLRIGQQKSASLPVVAPAIGEALIATAIGLFAAIPATVLYNAMSKRADDLLTELEAASEAWVALATENLDLKPFPLQNPGTQKPRAAQTPRS